jgi:formate dehydrogenase maturation protein FdhE
MIWRWIFIAGRSIARLFLPAPVLEVNLRSRCPVCGHRPIVARAAEFERTQIEGKSAAMIKLSCDTCRFQWFVEVISAPKWPAK